MTSHEKFLEPNWTNKVNLSLIEVWFFGCRNIRSSEMMLNLHLIANIWSLSTNNLTLIPKDLWSREDSSQISSKKTIITNRLDLCKALKEQTTEPNRENNQYGSNLHPKETKWLYPWDTPALLQQQSSLA